MSSLLDHQVTVGDLLYAAVGWLTVGALRSLAGLLSLGQHSTDGGEMGRRLRAEEALREQRRQEES